MPLSDSARIDRINDHAWELARTQPDSALAYADLAIDRSEALGGYPKGIINAHILMGIVNKDRGYYGLSVEHYLQALHWAEHSGDSLRVSGCLNNLGSVYQEQGDHGKSLGYFMRSLEIEKAMGKDKGQESIRLFNIGEAYQEMDSLDEAYAFYYNSLLIEEELKNKEGIFYARLGIGQLDCRMGNHEKAAEELAQALRYATETANNPGICEVFIAQGNLFLAEGKPMQALPVLDAALTKAKAFGYQGLEMRALGSLYKVQRAQQRFEQANATLEAYYAVREKVHSAEVNSRIGELQTRYELGKKEQEIAMFKQKEQVQAEKAKYGQKLRNYLIFTIAFAVAMILFNIRRNRKSKGGDGQA